MKFSTKIYACGTALLLGLLSSCNLNQTPSDLIRFDDSFKTLEDLKKWDNGIYSTLRGKMGGAFIMPQEVQADMLSALQSAGSYTEFYVWDIKANNATLGALYQAYYAALVDVNLVLNYSAKVELTDAEKAANKATLDRYLGDAYFARAFYYFKLEEVKAYEAAHGMKPAMNHPQTKLSTVSGYTDLYEFFAFEPETKTNDPGSLQTVVYFFNIPGLVDPTTGNPRDDMSHDPALAGTVGFRADFYKDANCAYRITPSWYGPEWDEFNPRSSTIKAGMKAGSYSSAPATQDTRWNRIGNTTSTYSRPPMTKSSP